jgi:hypothetical protein
MARVNVTSWLVVFLCCAVFPAVVAQLGITQTTATLSEARDWLAATSSGDLVLFGGGVNATPYTPSDRVDICNVTSRSWTTATLSIPRIELAAASSSNLVFFGGGSYIETPVYDRVDIYNVSNGSWSTASLSQARHRLAATSVGNLILFGGGYNDTGPSNVIDIYNVTNKTWTTATLSQARGNLAATSVTDRYALFAGGTNGTGPLNIVDIFDLLSRMWNTTTLSQPRSSLTAASVSDLAFFVNGNDGQVSNLVDIFNATAQTWSTATLSQARSDIAAASVGDIIAFGGGYNDSTDFSVVDMYNVTSNIWFTTTLSQARDYLAATSSLNKIFFGGGIDVMVFNVVDIFEVPLSPMSPMSLLQPQLTSSPHTLQPIVFTSTTVTSSRTIPSSVVTNTSLSTFEGLPSGAIVGIVVGTATLLIGVGVILFLILFIKRRKQRKRRTREYNENSSTMQQQIGTVVIESVTNTTTNDEMNATFLSSTFQPGTETLKGPFSGQIPLNELKIGNEIGQGTYGRVCVGKWQKYRVALKFCQNKGTMDEFLREANLMMSLPPHPNVVRMYGVSIDGTQPVIVMEYCEGGSLDKLLYDMNQQISNDLKIRWVYEIALGMSHLHKFNIIHRDLAARNILLSHPNFNEAHPKISDFGMSRVLRQDIEGRTVNKSGPACWMSPESIGKQVYSKKSDVWMFGVLVYEIAARREPHNERNPFDVLKEISEKGLTPVIPNDCPNKLRQLMRMCWNMDPQQRPTFETICTVLGSVA